MAMESMAAQNYRSAYQLASLRELKKNEMVKAPVYLTGKARRMNHKHERSLKALFF
jgi:hypothetical protein